MKKAIKNFIIFLIIVVTLIIFMFVFARYGWKLFGFALCDSPDMNFTEVVAVEDNTVHIEGGTQDSFSSFVGYVYKIDGSNLYIGVKHNLFLGFFSRIGSFDITIDARKAKITKIYYKNSKAERLIWTIEGGILRHQN